MKLKHTPGPWKAWGDGDIYLSVSPDSASPRDICHLHLPKNKDEIKEHEANARLIAAAPEMLETLLEYAKFELSQTDGIPEGLISVIEKATGMEIEEVLK